DVMRLHHSLRSTPYEANRTLALLSKMFNLAEAWRIRSLHSNPCSHVKRFPERKRERFLSTDELQRLGNALTDAERSGNEPPPVLAAINFLASAGCRRGESARLRGENLELDAGVIRPPEAKTGARTVPFGAPVLALLSALPRTSRYVLPEPMRLDQPLSLT